jgi:hypothetical protein
LEGGAFRSFAHLTVEALLRDRPPPAVVKHSGRPTSSFSLSWHDRTATPLIKKRGVLLQWEVTYEEHRCI